MGRTNPEIAAELNLARNTVKTYLQAAMHKLGARNRVEAIAKAGEETVVVRSCRSRGRPSPPQGPPRRLPVRRTASESPGRGARRSREGAPVVGLGLWLMARATACVQACAGA
ncbi:response regulator transcription factor [Streptomyces carpinensis]|nr:LuxR C-terminal-related transcriptional regulator [Streptomyces carpinensis]